MLPGFHSAAQLTVSPQIHADLKYLQSKLSSRALIYLLHYSASLYVLMALTLKGRGTERSKGTEKEIISISSFIKGCLFGFFFFLQKGSLSSKLNSLGDLKERDTIPLLFHLETLHLRLWFHDTFSFSATSA